MMLNYSEIEEVMYAFRDQARLYRRLRRDVQSGLIDHYTVDECTVMIKKANKMAEMFEERLDRLP